MGDLSRVIARIHAVRGIVIDAECDDGLYSAASARIWKRCWAI
jgi:hypothetical protein